MPMKSTSWRSLALLLVLAFAARLLAGWAWQERLPGRFGLGDTESYWVLGKAIAHGLPYTHGVDGGKVFRTPGYPILLAPIIRLVGDNQNAVLLARAEAAMFGTLAVLLVWWLTRLLFDDRAAMLAAAVATFYPGAVVLGVLILSEAPFSPLMLLQLALWTLAWRSASTKQRLFWAFLAGIVAGAATLMRPSWLLFTPFAIAVGLVAGFVRSLRRRDAEWLASERGTLARHLAIGLFMLVGLVVAMLPWWIRNARVTGRFIPTTLQVGASLYDGLNPDATGASDMRFVERYEQSERQAAEGSPESLEMRLDRRLRDAALAWARANPRQAIDLAGVKLIRLWNVWPNEPGLSDRRWVGWGVFFTYTPLLILAIIGAWRTIDRGWPYVLCWLPAVYLTMLHVVFVSSIRYREPAMLALLALAAGAGWRKRKQE